MLRKVAIGSERLLKNRESSSEIRNIEIKHFDDFFEISEYCENASKKSCET